MNKSFKTEISIKNSKIIVKFSYDENHVEMKFYKEDQEKLLSLEHLKKVIGCLIYIKVTDDELVKIKDNLEKYINKV